MVTQGYTSITLFLPQEEHVEQGLVVHLLSTVAVQLESQQAQHRVAFYVGASPRQLANHHRYRTSAVAQAVSGFPTDVLE